MHVSHLKIRLRATAMDSVEAVVLTAYLKPLVDKHNANEFITYEDLTRAHSSAMAALNRQQETGDVGRKLRSMHQQQVEAYKKAAIENVQSWAEEANSVDSLPLWRLVPQSIVDSAKQRVMERVSSSPAAASVEPEGNTEEEEEGEMVVEDGEDKGGVEEDQGDDAPNNSGTLSTIPEDAPVAEDTSAASETPKEIPTEPTKSKAKPKGGILAKKQAARGKGVNAKKAQQQVKSPPPQAKRGRTVRKTRHTTATSK